MVDQRKTFSLALCPTGTIVKRAPHPHIVYHDKSSTFYRLLKRDKSVTIHTRNLQYLATETFKVKTGISPTIMINIFKFCDSATHNLTSGQVLERRHNRTNNFGIE